MAKSVEGQMPRHKQWLGAYGPQASTTMKYRIPERLVTYLLDQLNIKEIVGSKCHCSISPPPGAIQVVTKHAEYVPPADSESDPESDRG